MRKMTTITEKVAKGHPVLRDTALIEQAVSGDRGARERLAVACLPRARKLVYMAYGPKEDLDDVVQIAMVTAFRDLSKLRKSGGFRAWFDTVVYNVVRSHGRRRGRFLSIFSFSDSEPPERTNHLTPEDETMGDQLFGQLQRHLGNISEKKRTAAVMSLFFGYVDTEIAELMSCTPEAAKKRVQHGRRELFARLQKDPTCRQLLEEVTR